MRTQIIDKTVVVSSVGRQCSDPVCRWPQPSSPAWRDIATGRQAQYCRRCEIDVGPYDDSPAPTGSPEVSPEIAAPQESILQGRPTKSFEASAAGGAPPLAVVASAGRGSKSNGGFVVIDHVGDATIAEAGFDTAYDTGVVINENQAEDLILENQLDDLGEVVVTLEDSQVGRNLLENSTNPDGPADASIVSHMTGVSTSVCLLELLPPLPVWAR